MESLPERPSIPTPAGQSDSAFLDSRRWESTAAGILTIVSRRISLRGDDFEGKEWMKKYTAGAVLAAAVLLGLGLSGCGGGGKQRTFLYLEKARGLGDVIMKQAEADLTVCRLYDTVWEYAAVSDMDFEAARREMMGGRPEALFLEMDTNQGMLARMMNLSKNPPKDCLDIQSKVDNLHAGYKKLHKYVREPPSLPQKEYQAKVQAFMDELEGLKEELDQAIALVSGSLTS
jgi:hypothetical protein